MNLARIRSGGQSGVDRAALDAAIATSIAYAGWCPKGGWAEDFPKPPGLLAKYKNLYETPSALPEQRTAWNVRDSTATLVLVNGTDTPSKGTEFTRLCAELIFERPFLWCDFWSANAKDIVSTWLMDISLATRKIELNIAGPRESESPGIYVAAYGFLCKLLSDLRS